MAVKLSPLFSDAPYVDSNGNPLNGGLVYTYTAGSSTPENTYTTSAGNVANANPIVLNSSGYPEASGSQVQVWLTVGVSYKFVLKTSAGVTLWTRDNITGINDTTTTADQWVSGAAPTYISATSFSLVGDQTSTYHVGRRLKTTNSGGTIYSTISASAFGAVTTITVVNDSGSLDSGLSAVSYGLLAATNPSTPLLTDAYPVVSGSSDKTKKARLEVDGLTTATTRVLTVLDADFSLGAATQAEQEAGTSNVVSVTPGRQHFHPSAAKAWGLITAPTTVTISYPAAGVSNTNPSTGTYVVTHGLTFSSTSYIVLIQVVEASSTRVGRVTGRTATTFTVAFDTVVPALADVTAFSYACFGDL